MTNFNMPGAGSTFEARGGWLVKTLATEFGLTLSQAAGIVGNLGFESGAFTKLHEIGQPEGRGGYGWGQWTADRRVTFLAYAKAKGLDWRSDEANVGYLMTELHGAYASTITALRKVATLDAAVFSVGQTYERPGGTTLEHLPGYADRLAWGKRALAGAQAGGVRVEVPAPPSAPKAGPPAQSTTTASAINPPLLPDSDAIPRPVAVPVPPISRLKPRPIQEPPSDDDETAEELTREANPGVFGS